MRILNIDIEEHPWVVDDFNIQSVPTLSVMINRKEVFQVTGRQEQDYIIALLSYLQQIYEESSQFAPKGTDIFSLKLQGVYKVQGLKIS